MNVQLDNEPSTLGKVLLKTTVGDVEVELWSKECPITCRNFIQLCMENYYDGTTFHRLEKGFIIQGGDPTGTGHGGKAIYESGVFKDEFHQRLRFNRRGLLGMANSGPNSNASQFFFTIGNDGLESLNRKNTMFGKVVGPTMFNLLRMTEFDVDDNMRPTTLHKITGTKVLENPFKDIIPRERERKKKEKKLPKPQETKKLNLLSFGDEAEDDELLIEEFNKTANIKAKSAHDVLDDEKLSKQVAVTADEMEDYVPVDDEDRDAEQLSKVRAKLSKKRKMEDTNEEERDDDFDRMIDEEKRRKEKEELDKMSMELKEMQRKYVKLLKPKPKKEAAPAPEPKGAMADYHTMKMKFKTTNKNKGIVKQKDSRRQSQTLEMLERFREKLSASNQEAILFDRKVTIPEKKEGVEEEEKTFGIDLDAEDIEGTDWMKHKFVAEDVDDSVSKAKDANLREESEDWYALNDPRNKMVKRRRGEE